MNRTPGGRRDILVRVIKPSQDSRTEMSEGCGTGLSRRNAARVERPQISCENEPFREREMTSARTECEQHYYPTKTRTFVSVSNPKPCRIHENS